MIFSENRFPLFRIMLYSPGLFPSSYGKTSSALEGLEAGSPRPLAWVFRRLRFSRSACFNRCCRESCFGFPPAPPVWPSARSLSSVIANLFEFVPQPMAEMHAAINRLAPLLQRAVPISPPSDIYRPLPRCYAEFSQQYRQMAAKAGGSAPIWRFLASQSGVPRLRSRSPCGKDRPALRGPLGRFP